VEAGFRLAHAAPTGASPSLFAGRRLLELRLGDAKPGDAGAKALSEYAARPAEDAVLLITAGKLDWKPRKPLVRGAGWGWVTVAAARGSCGNCRAGSNAACEERSESRRRKR
jgi:hypothetical protein